MSTDKPDAAQDIADPVSAKKISSAKIRSDPEGFLAANRKIARMALDPRVGEELRTGIVEAYWPYLTEEAKEDWKEWLAERGGIDPGKGTE